MTPPGDPSTDRWLDTGAGPRTNSIESRRAQRTSFWCLRQQAAGPAGPGHRSAPTDAAGPAGIPRAASQSPPAARPLARGSTPTSAGTAAAGTSSHSARFFHVRCSVSFTAVASSPSRARPCSWPASGGVLSGRPGCRAVPRLPAAGPAAGTRPGERPGAGGCHPRLTYAAERPSFLLSANQATSWPFSDAPQSLLLQRCLKVTM